MAHALKRTSARERRPAVSGRLSAGIDLGTHAAKVVVAADGGRPTIVAAARLVWPGDVEYCPVRQAALAAGWLRQWCSYHVKHVACTLPGSLIDYEAIVMPTGQMIDAQAELTALLGVDAAAASCDWWQGTPHDGLGHGESSTAHLVWTDGDVAQQIATALESHGFDCRSLQITPTQLAVLAAGRPDAATLVVDLGHETATAAVVDHGEVAYLRHRIALSTGGMVANVAQSLGVTHETVEALLADEAGLAQCRRSPSNGSAAIDQWRHTIAFEVRRTLEFVAIRRLARPVQAILLVGGGSAIHGLADEIAMAHGIEPLIAARTSAAVDGSAGVPCSPLYAEASALAVGGLAT